jgi:hypothetical protein
VEGVVERTRARVENVVKLLIGVGIGSVGLLAAGFFAYANRCTCRRPGFLDLRRRKL